MTSVTKLFLAALTAAAFGAGCNARNYDYNGRMEKVVQPFAAGQYATAHQEAAKLAAAYDKGGDKVHHDALIARLELGAAARAAGDIDRSIAAFDRAEDLIEQYDDGKEINLFAEGKAAVENLTVLPYRGSQYDRIMLSVYQGLNHLEKGDWPTARKWFKRATVRQGDAATKYAGQIAAEREKLAAGYRDESKSEAGTSGDLDAAVDNPEFRSKLARAEQGRAVSVPPPQIEYADYENPLVDYMHGLAFASSGDSAEMGYKGFRRAMSLSPECSYLESAIGWADAIAGGATPEPTTFVVYEQGMGPYREQFKIDVPLVLLPTDLGNVGTPGVAIPYLVYRPAAHGRLAIDAGGQRYETETLVDVDAVVKQEFDNEFKLVLAKTFAIAGVKAVAVFVTNETAESGGFWAWILSRLGTSAYQVVTNQADRRTWQTLPKEVQVAHFPTPADGTIRIDTESGGGQTVQLDPGGQVHVVFVKCPSRSAPLTVRQVAIPAGADLARAN